MSNEHVHLNAQDVQGNILSSYGASFARYLFYRIDLPDQARSGLAALISRITTEKNNESGKPRSMLNVAFTYQGLKALGISPNSAASFPPEFQEGMRNRAASLGDFGDSAPENWESPLGMPQLHMLVLVHGATLTDCTAMTDWVTSQMPDSDGVTLLSDTMEAHGLPDDKEHFGFRDGISQPWIQGTHPGAPIEPYGGKRTKEGLQPLNLGEFLLGHTDELDRLPQSPKPDLLGHNGTYLVLRRLYQDVARFRTEMANQAAYVFGDPSAKDRLAALTVGRWPSGCPVDLSWEKDNPSIAQDPSRINAFYFEGDTTGNRCPVGAHIRRTNPRDLTLDEKGNPLVEPMATRHRMIRRGLPYGPPLNGTEDDRQDRGLMFIALVADIARQFEFLQRNWINNGDTFRLDRTDRDPLIGNNRDARDVPPKDPPGQSHRETPRKLTVPGATRIPWALNLPEFVKTRGGDYFFLPSLTALQGLASLGFSSFMSEYTHNDQTILDPQYRAKTQSKLISDWLIYRPKEILDELLALATGPNGKIFQMPGYPVFKSPLASVSSVVIVTKYADVLEVLDSAQHPEMSVQLYRKNMEVAPPRPPRGPFILGRELSDPLYQLEMPILMKAVKDSPVSGMIPQILQGILDPIFAGIESAGKLDVIQDIAWPVPLGFNARFFGVPGPNPETFKRWLRNIYKDLFLNLRQNPEWSKEADLAAGEMNFYLDGLIQQISTHPDQFSPSVLRELIHASRTLPPESAPNFIRRNIMGLTVGVVETTLKAIARTVDQLIRRPKELHAAQSAAQNGDKPAVLAYALEAMRFNPQNHVLFRLCTSDTRIARGTPREATITKGTLVFAATLPAMFDADGPFDEPLTFRLDRDPAKYLFFGYDGHACLGRYLMPGVIQEVLMRLLRLNGLRRAHYDTFDPIDLVPEHLHLEFNPGR